MNMQNLYWKRLYHIRFRIFYLDLYADNAYMKNQVLQTISAVASSGSIAAWAIWQQLMPLWTFIIALSQVIHSVKGYLPYNTRLRNIEASQKNLKLLCSKMEFHWFRVQAGEMAEGQINELLYEFEKEYIEIEGLLLKGDILLGNKRRKKKAEEQTEEFFKVHFMCEKPYSPRARN